MTEPYVFAGMYLCKYIYVDIYHTAENIVKYSDLIPYNVVGCPIFQWQKRQCKPDIPSPTSTLMGVRYRGSGSLTCTGTDV